MTPSRASESDVNNPRRVPGIGGQVSLGACLGVVWLFVAMAHSTAWGKGQPLGDSPGFYGAMKPLQFGMTRKEVRAVAPFMTAVTASRREPLIYGTHFDRHGRLERVDIHFVSPDVAVLRGLQRAWGAGRLCTAKPEPGELPRRARVWMSSDSAIAVRAQLNHAGHPESLTFIPTMSWHATQQIHRVEAEVAAATRRLGPKVSQKPYGATAWLPGPPYTDGMEARWEAQAGRLRSLALSISVGDCVEAHKEVAEAIRGWASKRRPRASVVRITSHTWRIHIDTLDRQ